MLALPHGAALTAPLAVGVPIGTTGGDTITFDLIGRGGRQSVTLTELRKAHESFFPRLMGENAALA